MSKISEANSLNRRNFFVGMILTITVALTGCGPAENLTEQEYLERASEFRAAGNSRASVIALKNALQNYPDSAPARFMLGNLHLDVGNGVAAEKEFLRARELGIDADTVAIPLGRAWLFDNQFSKVLSEIRIDENDLPIRKAAILVLHGNALNTVIEARQAFEKALQFDPQSSGALVGLARLAMAQGELDQAHGYLDSARDVAPADLDVLTLKGDMEFAQGLYSESVSTFERIVKMRRDNFNYHMSFARALIAFDELERAHKELALVLAAGPNHPRANYLQALADYKSGEYQSAKERAEKVLALVGSHLPSLLIAGAASNALSEFEQAISHLSRFVAAVPGNAQARRLLGIAQMAEGLNAEAVATLAPLGEVSQDADDEGLLDLIGVAAVRNGDIQAGSDYFRRAVALRPDDSAARLRLGFADLALGEFESGLHELEAAARLSPELADEEFYYAGVLMQSGRYDEALEIAQNFQTEKPDEPIGYTLAGLVYHRMGDMDRARALFETALEIKPGAPDVAYILSRMSFNAEAPQESLNFLTDLLELDPENTFILLELAQVHTRLDDLGQAQETLTRILEIQPANNAVKLFMGRLSLARGNINEGLVLGRELQRLYPRDPAVLELVGKASLASGVSQDAVLAFESLVDIQPRSLAAHHLLLNAYKRAGDRIGLRQALSRAETLDADDPTVKYFRADDLLRQGDIAAAQPIVAALRDRAPDSPLVMELEGTLSLLSGEVGAALESYEKAFEARPTSNLAMQFAGTQWRAGAQNSAIEILEHWLDMAPGDAIARLQLGEYYKRAGRNAEAIAAYELMIEQQPKSWAGYNELAWFYVEMGEAGSAVPLAEAARARAPDNPAVLDTLGMAQMAANDYGRAVRTLERAHVLSPNSRTIGYHYALALNANGEIALAMEVLQDVTGDDQVFPERAAAAALLDELQG